MTSVGGNTFSGSIPGEQSPAVIEYYLSAADSTIVPPATRGQTVEYPTLLRIAMDGTYDADQNSYDPEEATPLNRRFFVGVKDQRFFDDFDSGGVTPSSHGGVNDDWQLGMPLGMGDRTGQFIDWLDPAAAHSGLYCWGNDLGINGGDGKYIGSANNWLRTPPISLAGVLLGDRVFLRFWRWLSLDRKFHPTPGGSGDLAEIKILTSSTAGVWKSHFYIPHVDVASPGGQWTPVEIDITNWVAAAPSVQVEWSLVSDGDTHRPNLGGWNIDDVEVFVVKAAP